MTPAEARERFSAAAEAELSGHEKPAFDALLASDPALAADYERFRAVLETTARLGSTRDSTAPPRLLSGVQRKLRSRSGGRVYRDRFAEVAGSPRALLPMTLLAVAAVILGVTWILYSFSAIE